MRRAVLAAGATGLESVNRWYSVGWWHHGRGGGVRQMEDGAPLVPDGVASPPRRSRLRRWLRRLGLALLALVVAVTGFCWVYNAATAGRAGPPAGVSFVATADTRTRYRQWGTGRPAGGPVPRAARSRDPRGP